MVIDIKTSTFKEEASLLICCEEDDYALDLWTAVSIHTQEAQRNKLRNHHPGTASYIKQKSSLGDKGTYNPTYIYGHH